MRDCSIEAAKAIGCLSPMQLTCVCPGGQLSSQFQAAGVNCLISSGCDLMKALATAQQLCKAGVDCNLPFRNCELATGEVVCIDPTLQTCASGSIINHIRRAFMRMEQTCGKGEKACRVFGGKELAFECLDTENNIESCGGCPLDGGEDCTAIFGARAVECVRGRCHVRECEKGLQLVDGRCE